MHPDLQKCVPICDFYGGALESFGAPKRLCTPFQSWNQQPLVCMCLCVFPDCSGLTFVGLLHFGNLSSIENMTLEGVNASIINGEDGQKDPGSWIRGLSSSMKELTISGELRRHLHAINVMERQQMQYF